MPMPRQPPAPPPSRHSVKFTLAAVCHVAPRLRELPAPPSPSARVLHSQRAPKKPATARSSANPSPTPASNIDDRRSFQLSYAIASLVPDAKSAVFVQPEIPVIAATANGLTVPGAPVFLAPSPPATWSASHDLEISTDIATMLLAQKNIEIIVHEIVKVEVEKKVNPLESLPTNSKLPTQATKTQSGLTRDVLEANGIDVAILDASLADSGLGAKQQKRLKALKDALGGAPHSDDSESSKDSSTNGLKAAEPGNSSKVNNGTVVEMAEVRISHSASALSSPSSIHDIPHPHHYDHPEKHLRSFLLSRSGSESTSRPRSAQSLVNLSRMRTKTPPSPHHSEAPISILVPRGGSKKSAAVPPPQDVSRMRMGQRRASSGGISSAGKITRSKSENEEPSAALISELRAQRSLPHLAMDKKQKQAKEKKRAQPPKKKYILETRKLPVGKIIINLTNLFCGELSVDGMLQHAIDGITSIKTTLTLDIPLLSPPQRQFLCPVSITLVCVENLPETTAHTFAALDAKFLPTTLAFRFYNDPSERLYTLCANRSRARLQILNSRFVIFAGLLGATSGDVLRWTREAPFEVRVYDRIPKTGNEGDNRSGVLKISEMGPFGVAAFDLSEFFESGVGVVRRRAPVLPASREFRQQKSFIQPMWMESNTTVVIEVEAFSSLVDSGIPCYVQDEGDKSCVYRSNANQTISSKIDQFISSATSSQAQLYSNDENAVEHTSNIFGYVFSLPSEKIYILEGINEKIADLKTMLSSEDTKSPFFKFDPDTNFEESRWGNTIDLADGSAYEYPILKYSFAQDMEEYVREPHNYVFGSIPEDAFRTLMWINEIKDMRFLTRNARKFPPWCPARKQISMFASTFGRPADSPISPGTLRTSDCDADSSITAAKCSWPNAPSSDSSRFAPKRCFAPGKELKRKPMFPAVIAAEIARKPKPLPKPRAPYTACF
ncbi:hypothetical protein HDU83_000517 [Entophlyctis luteolus]|nr:hypothetical protein HDU83_000517 [Entophlyctis luteolus]